MSCYLCVDGASPLFLKALEKLVHSHVSDLRSNVAASKFKCAQPAPWLQVPMTPVSKNTGGNWDLPTKDGITLMLPGSDIKLCMPPQPSPHEWSFPSTGENNCGFLASPHSNIGCEDIKKTPDYNKAAEQDIDLHSDDVYSDIVDLKGSKDAVKHVESRASQQDKKRISKRVPSATEEENAESFDFKASYRSIESVTFRGTMRNIVKHKAFEGFFSAVIMINCVTIGLEADQDVKGPASDVSQTILLVMEHLFTALFTVELICKFLGFGCTAFSLSFPDGKWNLMDIFLVLVTGVLFTWILPIVASIFNLDNDSGFVNTLTIFRSIRLMRLVRVLQRLPQFREAWLLLRGLLDSGRVLVFTVMVIFFVTYLFAILGLVTISKELVRQQDAADLAGDKTRYDNLSELVGYVGGLDLLMYTLVQLLTLDSWNGIVRRILEELNLAWIYFYAYIAVACFVLMNLVTAIIVDNALCHSRMDEDEALKRKEKQQRDEIKQLEKLFNLMDTDNNGTLSWQEFKAAFDDPDMCKKWRILDFEPDECQELFGLLDDGDGEISTGEFFEGLQKMKGIAQSKDIFRILKEVQGMKASLRSEARKSERSA